MPRKASHNNLNQITGREPGGPLRVRGELSEPGWATVNGQAARPLTGNQFEATITSTSGSNVITVQATDASSNSQTKQWSVNVSGSTETAFTYDSNGNMLTGGGLTYTWDALDRLKTVSGIGGDPTRTTTLEHDPLGRRIRITEQQGVATLSDKRYIWVGLRIVEERDWTTNAVIKRFYTHGEQRLSGSDAGDYFYTRDHLGSIREVTTGSAATVVARYDYDPYGRRTQTSGTFTCDFGFTGHWYHVPTTLHLAPYRGYSAELGRWLNRDLIGEAGGVNLCPRAGTGTWFLAFVVPVKPGEILAGAPARASGARSSTCPSSSGAGSGTRRTRPGFTSSLGIVENLASPTGLRKA